MIEIPEIKGCPHCGESVSTSLRADSHNAIQLIFYCKACSETTFMYVYGESLSDFINSLNKRIETWNTRTGGKK